MRELAKWIAIGLWLLEALVLGYALGAWRLSSKQLNPILHPMKLATVDGRPTIVSCSERIVEIPFVHRNLPYPFRGRVLDVGYLESEVIFQLASLGFETRGIDIRPESIKFPGIHFVQGDICHYSFTSGHFDTVIALSTIEHSGLARYGNVNYDSDGDLHALEAVHRFLKPNGKLLTVPFGKRGKTIWYRVYDHESLQVLLTRSGFKVETEACSYQRGIQ